MKKNRKYRNVLITLAFPAATYLLMELLSFGFKDMHIISSILDVKTIIRNTGITAVTAYAMSFNLNEGRFDLSLGAQRGAGTIIGGILAMRLGLSGGWLLLFAVVFGFLFGVTGMEVLRETWFQILVVVLMAVFVMILMNYTRFGYEMKAMQGSQIIAANSGINLFRHAVECYTLAGAMVAIAGVLEVSFTTQMAANLGNTSNGVIVANMFAMSLGGFIGEFSDPSVGVIVAAFTITVFKYGLTNMQLSEANSNVVNMLIFIAFLVWSANRHKPGLRRDRKARIELAQEKKRAMAQQG